MTPKDSEKLFYFAWPTAWGPMGAVASERGLRRIVLPHYQLKDLLDLLAWENPGALRDEGPFAAFIQLTRDYFNAKPVDFTLVACELPGEEVFAGKVYRACRSIPYGRTQSYLGLAKLIDREDAARAVATALSKNPVPLLTPCHRVTYSDGRMGGFSAMGGVDLKKRLLDLERKVAAAGCREPE